MAPDWFSYPTCVFIRPTPLRYGDLGVDPRGNVELLGTEMHGKSMPCPLNGVTRFVVMTAKRAALKTSAKKVQVLNRYTSLPIALDVLVQQKITLLNPETWEDRNDAYFLERYRDEKKLRSVLAICFSRHRETFHHWRVFSSGCSGVCIEFDKSLLLQSIPNKPEYQRGNVEYYWIRKLRKDKPRLDKWPFLKRKPFEDEREYRIIFETNTESLRAHSIQINLGSIRKVTLSPWLPEAVATSVIEIIRNIPGCARLKVSRSSLIHNAEWRAVID